MKKKKSKNQGVAAAAGRGSSSSNNQKVHRNYSQQQQQQQQRHSHDTPKQLNISLDSIKGMDDAGHFYNSYHELLAAQEARKTEFYTANGLFWKNDGYGGTTDDEAMVGDIGGNEDGEEGLAFLDLLTSLNRAGSDMNNTTMTNNDTESSSSSSEAAVEKSMRDNGSTVLPLKASSFPLVLLRKFDTAIDLGAGVGRVTKLVLLKRYDTVRLVEADGGWSKRSKIYLGRKRAARCSFVNSRLDDLTPQDMQNWAGNNDGVGANLMWLQWTFQYMIDVDVISSLIVLATGLCPNTGVLVVKENRPYGMAREDRFQMDTPCGENQRYDITRSDAHHRLLFQKAGLTVVFVQKGVETHTYALMR